MKRVWLVKLDKVEVNKKRKHEWEPFFFISGGIIPPVDQEGISIDGEIPIGEDFEYFLIPADTRTLERI